MSAEIIVVPESPRDEGAFDVETSDFWPKVACWTPEEAAMLSLGLEPTILAPSVPPEPERQDSIPYRQRRLLILRAMEVGQLRNPLTPLTFVEWAKQYGIQIPEDLRLAVLEYDRKHRKTIIGDSCNAKVFAGMQKMIFGMAIGGYGWNPADLRSPIVSDIVHDLEKAGISLSEGTVRSRLNEANDRYGSPSVEQPDGPR